MPVPIRPPRPQLTPRILAYLLADLFGLVCIAIGASWLAAGRGAIFADFPTSTVEAVICAAGGAAVMIWAIARILGELAKQGPAMQAQYEGYMAAQPAAPAKPEPEPR